MVGLQLFGKMVSRGFDIRGKKSRRHIKKILRAEKNKRKTGSTDNYTSREI